MALDVEGGREAVGSRGFREGAALFLLLFGGFFFFVGWVVGAALLWSSRGWTTRDKWIGTLCVPGGLLTPFYVWLGPGYAEVCFASADGVETCIGGPGPVERALWIVLGVFVLVAPIASNFYLARRAGRVS